MHALLILRGNGDRVGRIWTASLGEPRQQRQVGAQPAVPELGVVDVGVDEARQPEAEAVDMTLEVGGREAELVSQGGEVARRRVQNAGNDSVLDDNDIVDQDLGLVEFDRMNEVSPENLHGLSLLDDLSGLIAACWIADRPHE
eukprot:scaffold30024_cov41-Prasinocladus_malaysianus.AAC.3